MAVGQLSLDSFTTQGISSLVVKLVGFALALLSTMVLARLLGAKGMGQYSVVFSVVSLLGVCVKLGLPQLVVRETAKAQSNSNWALIRGVWHWSQAATLAGSVLIVLLVGAGLLGNNVDVETSRIYIYGLAYIPLFALLTISGGALVGLGHVILGQLPEHILKPALLVASVGIFVAVHPVQGLSPAIAMGCQAIVTGAALLAGVFLLLRVIPGQIKLEKRREFHTSAWLLAAGTLGLLSGLNVLMANLDIVMLGWLQPIDEAGIYRVAVAASAIVSFGLQSTNLIIMPAIARLFDANDTVALQSLLDSSIRFVMVVGLVAFGSVVLLGEWLLGVLFGSEFEAAFWPLVILALGQLLNAAFGPVAMVLNMGGFERETLVGYALAAVLNAILNAVLIPVFGMIGAAIASVVGLLFWNVFLYRRAKIKTGLDCSVSIAFRKI